MSMLVSSKLGPRKLQTVDLRAYRAKVVDAMRKTKETGEPVVFENTGPSEASIVLEIMCDDARSSLDVVSGCLDRTAWDATYIDKFLSRSKDARIRALLDEADEGVVPERSILSDLDVGRKGQITAKFLPAPRAAHLCVADGKHVRLEIDRRTFEASVTFGDSKNAGPRAASIFQTLWDSVEHLPPLDLTKIMRTS